MSTEADLPGITVAVACHPARLGNGLWLEAMASVAAQTLTPDAIVVVVDKGRQGAGWTRRQVLAAIGTLWTAWIDDDDLWDPEHLEKLYRVATETDSVFVYSWFNGPDPLGHFGRPFNPCQPHHTTMSFLVRTELMREVGFCDSADGPYSNEDWAMIVGISELACKRGLKMTHLPERTWTYRQEGQNSSGLPGRGDAA